jgi:hypothetical protein
MTASPLGGHGVNAAFFLPLRIGVELWEKACQNGHLIKTVV